MATVVDVHGLLQIFAFVIVFPAGILVAIFRDALGPTWIRWHLVLQLIGTIMVTTAIVLIKIKRKNHSHDSIEGKGSGAMDMHRYIGPVVFVALVLQWIWALYMRGKIDWIWWFRVHVVLAGIILLGGWFQIYLGIRAKNEYMASYSEKK